MDRFIEARLREKGFRKAPPADRRTLVRRLSYDLTGLPPSPELQAAEVCVVVMVRLILGMAGAARDLGLMEPMPVVSEEMVVLVRVAPLPA